MTDQTLITTENLAAIAAELPGDWTGAAVHDWSGKLTRADGLTLHVWHAANEERARIVLDVPHELVRYNETKPAMRASLTRSPAALARDIARRVLPDAETMHALILERLEERDAYETAKDDTLAAVRAAMGAAAGAPVSHLPDEVGLSHTVDGYGRVRAHRDTVSMELHSLPREVALDMLAALAAHVDQDAAHLVVTLPNVDAEQADTIATDVVGWLKDEHRVPDAGARTIGA